MYRKGVIFGWLFLEWEIVNWYNNLMENKYFETLENMQEPKVPKAKLDIRGIIEYAKSKEVPVEELSAEDKAKFIEYIEV